MILLSVALAAEIGANAPDWTKPCASPIKTIRFATKADPQYEYVSHIRRTPPETCEGTGLITSFAERAEPAELIPPEETIAAAQMPEAAMPGSEADSRAPLAFDSYSASLITSGAAAFIDFGGGSTGIIGVYPQTRNLLPPAYIAPVPELPASALLFSGLLALVGICKKPTVV